MSLAGIVFLVGVFLTIFTLAAYLIRVARILVHVNFTLGTIIAGVRAIATQCEPWGQLLARSMQIWRACRRNSRALSPKPVLPSRPDGTKYLPPAPEPKSQAAASRYQAVGHAA